MKKLALGLTLVLVSALTVRANALTGEVNITSGGAWLSDTEAAFVVQGSSLSLNSATPTWVYDVPTESALGVAPYIGEPFSYWDYVPAFEDAGFWSTCDPGQSDGTYEGVTASCLSGGIAFSSSDMTTQGDQYGVTGASGTFTATGEITGWGPANCDPSGRPITEIPACTELFDVTLTGQGNMTMTTGGGGYQFDSVSLQFTDPPDPAPEPPTGLLLLGGLAIFVALRLSNSSHHFLRA